MLYKPKLYSTEKLFFESDLLSMHGSFLLNSVQQVLKDKDYEIVKNQTRQATNIKIIMPKIKKSISQKCYDFVGKNCLNDMPKELRVIMLNNNYNSKISKYSLKKWLKNQKELKN